MRRMANAAINGSNSLFIGGCRVTNACQNTEPDKRSQETSILIFFRCVINDAHPATSHGRQLLHLNGIRCTDALLVLSTLLCPANKRTFQAEATSVPRQMSRIVVPSSRTATGPAISSGA